MDAEQQRLEQLLQESETTKANLENECREAQVSEGRAIDRATAAEAQVTRLRESLEGLKRAIEAVVGEMVSAGSNDRLPDNDRTRALLEDLREEFEGSELEPDSSGEAQQ
jgi:hypothetical protein